LIGLFFKIEWFLNNGLVKYPKEWKHSSFHEFVKKKVFIPNPSWGGPVEGIQDGIGWE
jgi:hypothetical protein